MSIRSCRYEFHRKFLDKLYKAGVRGLYLGNSGTKPPSYVSYSFVKCGTKVDTKGFFKFVKKLYPKALFARNSFDYVIVYFDRKDEPKLYKGL